VHFVDGIDWMCFWLGALSGVLGLTVLLVLDAWYQAARG
jgi:hypothetical protein